MTQQLEPIVLIGAARSGTKILRDALATALGVPQVPYDVGYVWRYGNEPSRRRTRPRRRAASDAAARPSLPESVPPGWPA